MPWRQDDARERNREIQGSCEGMAIPRGLEMKRPMILAALVATAAAGLATAIPADAAVSSASIDKATATATLNLDATDDNVTVSVSGGLLVHDEKGGGLNSGSDWDSAIAGDQTVPADGTFTVVVNGGDGTMR